MAYLILTSSNGTTTKDSVALKTAQKVQRHGMAPSPSAQLLPRCATGQDGELLGHLCFSGKLEEGLAPEIICSARRKSAPHNHKGNAGAYNLVARLGASSNRGGTRPRCHPTRKLDGSGRAEQARRARPRYKRPNLQANMRHEKLRGGGNVRVPFLSNDRPEASDKLHATRSAYLSTRNEA